MPEAKCAEARTRSLYGGARGQCDNLDHRRGECGGQCRDRSLGPSDYHLSATDQTHAKPHCDPLLHDFAFNWR
jgi:hypothetical protein